MREDLLGDRNPLNDDARLPLSDRIEDFTGDIWIATGEEIARHFEACERRAQRPA